MVSQKDLICESSRKMECECFETLVEKFWIGKYTAYKIIQTLLVHVNIHKKTLKSYSKINK